MQRHAQQAPAQKKGILDQMSMPAVLAAVLTSMTSFMFSSKLGLTGSLIGAALAAAVSTIASQLYNAMINSSVEKIQDLSKQMAELSEERQSATAIPDVHRTQVRQSPTDPHSADVASNRYTPIAPEALREEAARRHRATIMKRTFVVAVVAALAALLAYGIIVRVATQGQGIGPTSFEEISQPVSQNTEATTSEDATTQTNVTDETVAQTNASGTVDANGTATGTDSTTDTSTTPIDSPTTDATGTGQGTSGTVTTGTDSAVTDQGASTETPSLSAAEDGGQSAGN